MISQSVAWQIARYRNEQGLTLKEVEFRAGINVSTLSHYEHARMAVPPDKLARIAAALQVTVTDLQEEVPDGYSPQINKRLNAHQQRTLDYWLAYRSSHGHSPTLREAAKDLGYSSAGTIQEHLTKLKELDYLAPEEGELNTRAAVYQLRQAIPRALARQELFLSPEQHETLFEVLEILGEWC